MFASGGISAADLRCVVEGVCALAHTVDGGSYALGGKAYIRDAQCRRVLRVLDVKYAPVAGVDMFFSPKFDVKGAVVRRYFTSMLTSAGWECTMCCDMLARPELLISLYDAVVPRGT